MAPLPYLILMAPVSQYTSRRHNTTIMKGSKHFVLPVIFLLFSCNSKPPRLRPDLAGLYYPSAKGGTVDSSEVLHIALLDSNAYEFRIAGNSGIGKFKDGVVSGELSGRAIGKAPFTFIRSRRRLYEFRAYGSKVELVKLKPDK
jgi:hypothetical protein